MRVSTEPQINTRGPHPAPHNMHTAVVCAFLAASLCLPARCEHPGASADPEPFPPGQSRTPRTLFKKLHSGAAFLAGLKLGAVLSKKGFELGHGKIASSHSFQIFGKSVNSAMSLAYGNADSLLPLVDDEADPKAGKREEVLHVRVVDSCNGTREEGAEREDEVEDKVVVLYREEDPTADFLAEHNSRVKELNEDIVRRKNSKF